MANSPTLSVILPTWNEHDALALLAPRLDRAIAPYEAEVLVVDDASDDGTPDLVRSLAERGPYRLLERRGTRGLASAVVEGFRSSTGRVLVVLDADGSHPPERIPALVGPVLDGAAELVLGSRRVPGGGAPGLAIGRAALSEGARLLARPLTSVRDPLSGYFALARPVLDRAPLDPVGFKIALEILVKCRPRPVLEVPIVFGPRLAGESKLGGGTVGAFLTHLGRLYGWRALRGAGPPGPGRPSDPVAPRAAADPQRRE